MTGVHVCQGVNRRYSVYVRAQGARKYERVGPATKSRRAALRRLADEMDREYSWERGVIMLSAEYYEPVVIFEIVRR